MHRKIDNFAKTTQAFSTTKWNRIVLQGLSTKDLANDKRCKFICFHLIMLRSKIGFAFSTVDGRSSTMQIMNILTNRFFYYYSHYFYASLPTHMWPSFGTVFSPISFHSDSTTFHIIPGWVFHLKTFFSCGIENGTVKLPINLCEVVKAITSARLLHILPIVSCFLKKDFSMRHLVEYDTIPWIELQSMFDVFYLLRWCWAKRSNFNKYDGLIKSVAFKQR